MYIFGSLLGLVIGLSLLVGLGWLVLDFFRNIQTWTSLPDEQDYKKIYMENENAEKNFCNKCNSLNIIETGFKKENDSKRVFICNDCGSLLYKKNS